MELSARRRVTLLFVDDCPHRAPMESRLLRAAEAEGVVLELTSKTIRTLDEATRFGFVGSPTVLVDGVDPFGSPDDPPALACRRFPTPGGPAGVPDLDDLRAALRSPSPSGDGR